MKRESFEEKGKGIKKWKKGEKMENMEKIEKEIMENEKEEINWKEWIYININGVREKDK